MYTTMVINNNDSVFKTINYIKILTMKDNSQTCSFFAILNSDSDSIK